MQSGLEKVLEGLARADDWVREDAVEEALLRDVM